EGILVVCHEGKGNSTDVVFLGAPTPDMVPLDAEAKALSDKANAGLKHPINDLAPTYAEGLIESLQKEMSEVKQASAAPEGMTELLAAMAGMMKQNQEILAALTKPVAPTPAALKRA